MASKINYLRMLAQDVRGQDMVEYALFAGFLAVLAAASVPTAVAAVGNCWAKIVDDLNGLAGGLSGS